MLMSVFDMHLQYPYKQQGQGLEPAEKHTLVDGGKVLAPAVKRPAGNHPAAVVGTPVAVFADRPT